MNHVSRSLEGVVVTSKKSALPICAKGSNTKIEKGEQFSDHLPILDKHTGHPVEAEATTTDATEPKLAAGSGLADPQFSQSAIVIKSSKKDSAPDQKRVELDEPVDDSRGYVTQLSQLETLISQFNAPAKDNDAEHNGRDSTYIDADVQSKSPGNAPAKSTVVGHNQESLAEPLPVNYPNSHKELQTQMTLPKAKMEFSVVKFETHFDFAKSDLQQVPTIIVDGITEEQQIFAPSLDSGILGKPAAQVKTLHIHLQPEELGELKVVMSLRGKMLNLKIEASSVEAAAHLTKDHQRLKELITSAGFEMEDKSILISVGRGVTAADTSTAGDFNGAKHETDQRYGQNSQPEFGGRREHESAHEDQNFKSLLRRKAAADSESAAEHLNRWPSSNRFI